MSQLRSFVAVANERLVSAFRSLNLAAFSLFVLVLCALNADSVGDLIQLWVFSDTHYSHGLLLVGVAAFLLARELTSGELTIKLGYAGLVWFICLSFLWFVSKQIQLRIGWQLSFVLMPMALFWALFGSAALRENFIPLLLPACAIPVWDVLNQGDLQLISAMLVGEMLKVVGIPVVQEGIQLQIPSGVFAVEENCSGMRQIVVALPLCLIYAHLQRFRWVGTVLLALGGMVLGIVVNVIRIMVVVTAGHITDMNHYFVTEDHITLGWVLFSGFMFAFLLFVNRMPDSAKRHHPAAGGHAGDSVLTSRWLFCLFVAMLIGPLLEWSVDARSTSIAPTPMVKTVEVPGWDFDGAPAYAPVSATANLRMDGLYRSGTERVGLNTRTFWGQVQGREAVSSDIRLHGHGGWQVSSPATLVEIETPDAFSVQELVVHGSGGEKRLVWMWFQIGSEATGRAFLAKLLELRNMIFAQHPTILVTLDTVCDSRIQSCRARLLSFWKSAEEPIVRHAAEEFLQADTAVQDLSK